MILFLDFDGVLHPFNRATGALALVPRFEHVMRDFPDVDIVVSSAWRTDHTLEQLRAFFCSDIASRMIDVTPAFHYLEHQYVRQAEITAWLRDAGREYESWVAIDDSEWCFAPGCRNLILVDTEAGFNDATEQALRRRLTR